MAGIPKDVWYAGGLRFQCTQCGDCCSGAEGYVWVNQAEIDALAGAMDRSRNYIVNQAIEQYLEANTWQMERIRDGIAATREGKVAPAGEVFAGIAAKHGWSR